jgi:hypothetical protein
MSEPLAQLHSNAATLGRGAEALLRRFLRFFVGRISLVRLQELINQLYVEELEDRLTADDLDRSVTLSMLALNTGLDTRQIIRIRSHPSYRGSLAEEAEFLRDLTPAASFLHIWTTDKRFIDKSTGLPKPLPFTKKGRGADLVVKELRLPRGITITSVIAQLESSGLVSVDRDQDVIRMTSYRFLPDPDKDAYGALEVGIAAICKLTETVLANLENDGEQKERLFQRVYWTNRLDPAQRAKLRNKLRSILEKAEKKSCETLIEFEPGFDLPDQVSAGFGLYLFED